MADVKISGLPASTIPLAGTEVLPIVQGGVTKKVAVSDLTAGRSVSMASLGVGTATPALLADVVFSSAGDGIRVLNTLATGFADIRVGNDSNANLGILRVGGSTIGNIYQNTITLLTAGGYNIQIAPQGVLTMAFDPSANATLTSGNLVIGTSGKGIDFSATAGTGTSELLADYEEGTWTMGLSFGGGTTGITYTVNTGRYIKIGKSVTVTGFLLLSSKGSSAGAAQITGLPYTIGAGNPSQSVAATRFGNSTFVGQYFFAGSIGTTTLDAGVDNGVTGTPANLLDTNFANNSLIQISYTYFVD